MPGSVIVAGARTPIGKMSGSLGDFTAMDLGGFAIKEALKRANIDPGRVQYTFIGHVLQAGQGQITARQAAVKAGIPMDVPATTINKVCLSGINAIYLADLLIQAGEADIVVAGGMESMTRAPYLIQQGRSGYRFGDGTLVDSMLYDGLFCAFDNVAMGLGTERYCSNFPKLTRDRQDQFSANSHDRAANAIKSGRFADEIVAIAIPQRKGDPIIVDTDEGVRPGTTAESLGKLRPAFDPSGTITAGNSSQISDGATALVVVSKKVADTLGVQPLGEVLSYGQVAGPDASLLTQPSRAIMAALTKISKSVKDVDLFEINEAFAAVSLASMEDLGVSEEIVNVNGGAVALGHPIGSSGARISYTLLEELKRRGGGIGAAALCGGGGQGDALIVKAY